VGLITRRSQVQILSPQPEQGKPLISSQESAAFAFSGRRSGGAGRLALADIKNNIVFGIRMKFERGRQWRCDQGACYANDTYFG
ncbi:MAG: hypothetical protein V4462_09670, partial [Pseudomonadota bacterium]